MIPFATPTAIAELGLAFPLLDDLSGVVGSTEQAGRETGGDLREFQRTPLPTTAQERIP